MNKSILITGATGNIGSEVIHYLYQSESKPKVIAAVRDEDRKNQKLLDYPDIELRSFDFDDESTFQSALSDIDILFLLRPPQISDVEKYFPPLFDSAKKAGIKKIVFLSVQNADKSKVIPHNKIERLIKEYAFDYIFVRPAYFMQNLTTTMLPEIRNKHSVTLPSGDGKFNWIDAKNIGEATAQLLLNFDNYKNDAYDITGKENKSYPEVTEMMSEITGKEIKFNSINPVSFYFRKRKEGLNSGFAMVMTILHFLPRLQKEPDISQNYEMLTGKKPTSIREFLEREKEKFLG